MSRARPGEVALVALAAATLTVSSAWFDESAICRALSSMLPAAVCRPAVAVRISLVLPVTVSIALRVWPSTLSAMLRIAARTSAR